MKWYVVFHGRVPGVYADWPSCHAQVSGFSKACYKGFKSELDATRAYKEWLMQLDNGNKLGPEPEGSELLDVHSAKDALPAEGSVTWKIAFFVALFALFLVLSGYIG